MNWKDVALFLVGGISLSFVLVAILNMMAKLMVAVSW